MNWGGLCGGTKILCHRSRFIAEKIFGGVMIGRKKNIETRKEE